MAQYSDALAYAKRWQANYLTAQTLVWGRC